MNHNTLTKHDIVIIKKMQWKVCLGDRLLKKPYFLIFEIYAEFIIIILFRNKKNIKINIRYQITLDRFQNVLSFLFLFYIILNNILL